MPNHVEQVLSVFGPKEEVRRFVAAVRGKRPLTGDAPGSGNYSEKRHVEWFCFHALVPLPKRYSEVPYGDQTPRNGYDLEVETWGVKWGAYDEHKPVVESRLATFKFTTAWDACHVLMSKAAPQWPKLRFYLSWGGEGPCRGRAFFQCTTLHIEKEKYRKEDYPSDEDYEADEEAASKAYQAAQRLRMTEHAAWVGKDIAAGAGLDFRKDDAPLADWLVDNGYPKLAEWVQAKNVTLKPRSVK